MSIGLDWINDVALWLGDLIPQWDLLEVTNGGVKFLPGGKVKVLNPGIYWWWPATTTVVEIPIKRKALTITQRLTTKDGYTVMVSTVIVYIVDDVYKAVVETTDFEDTIGEMAQKITIKPIMLREFDEITRDMSESNEMRNEVTRAARSMLSDFGVGVIDAYVSDFAATTLFSHDGEGLLVAGEDDE